MTNFIDYIKLAKDNITMNEVINACGDTMKNSKFLNKCIFTIHDSKNEMEVWDKSCFCYNCWKQADVVSYWYESKHFSSQLEAAKDLCNYMGLSSDEKYNINNNVKNHTYNNIYKKEDYTISSILKSCEEAKKEFDVADAETLDIVYTVFKEACEEYNKCVLLPNHYKHLKEERKISDNMIKKLKLFSFPFIKEVDYENDSDVIKSKKYSFNNKVSDKIISIMEAKFNNMGKDINILLCVPLFQFDTKYNKFTVNLKYNGIVIPITPNGIIEGLQLRMDTKPKPTQDNKKPNRYKWLTSKTNFKDINKPNTNDIERYKYGAHSIVQATPIYPDEIKNNKIFITEGVFKAEKIASTLGSIAISIQSVGPWKTAIPVFTNILKTETLLNKVINCNEEESINDSKIKENIEVVIALDADGKCNERVSESGANLANVFNKEGFKVSYVTWDINFGKGIDDVINNGYLNKIYKYDKDTWEEKYRLISSYLMKKFDKHLRDIKDEKENWLKAFQKLEVYTNLELKEHIKINH